ncbi:hypothetical protein FJV41_19710 [Myxococcus llanfairpwllgwyngyllgogerychwyrndrobwllllantysiliogogogochensis]|uniref:Uncharacterized protein n=1 Tax=Myxococcus llanfairpwllgwyngyllgogerychwyrndrobwllllantysiliogogogochensis TaxID=2590453 RepID=A0A540WYW1_9BACT|nr:hypothetical protein [Myxococcus llanfairpwllgwyngyllgogerychwyrndrobwllllantysiliogogogochensis]TQF14199.1 hypothetical protein FJV41_19710 [Myxococcus llanfairpwllgwyngyllgogerychwyrndrobwllllantysiliogogogochensis]
MRTDQDNRSKQICDTAQTVSTLDAARIIGSARQDGGALPFMDAYVAASLELLKLLANVQLSTVPLTVLNPIMGHTSTLLNNLTAATSYNDRRALDTRLRDTTVTAISKAYDDLYTSTAPHLALALLTSTGEAANQAHVELASIKAAKAEGDRILAEVKAYAIDAIVASQAAHFSSEAVIHEEYAQRWLGGIAGSAAVVLLITIYASLHPPGALVDNSLPLTVLAYIPRFFALSVAFYALSLCARNYRTSRHNYIVNRHRALALSTFNVFASTASDSKVKDVILAQAASTIFAPQTSGYSIDQAEPLPHATAIDLLQRISPPKT